jgi:hypothetical protein
LPRGMTAATAQCDGMPNSFCTCASLSTAMVVRRRNGLFFWGGEGAHKGRFVGVDFSDDTLYGSYTRRRSVWHAFATRADQQQRAASFNAG